MFRAAYRSSSGVLTVFAASGLHTPVVTGRSQFWLGAGSAEYSFVWQPWIRKKTGGLMSVPSHVLKMNRYWSCNWTLDGDWRLASLSEWGASSVHWVGARRETHWASLSEWCAEEIHLLSLSWTDPRCVRCPTRRLVSHRLSCSVSLRSVLTLF